MPVAAFAALLLGASLGAHHRFSETYLEEREITIEGEVVRWEYGDPHSFLHVVIRNGRNEPERWIVECLSARRLQRQGVTPDTIKPGQRLILTGSPGRIAADHRLRLRAIVRPQDGWKWREAPIEVER
jgi:hypothetical protein